LRSDLFIVSRASDEAVEPKLVRAGANRVLCPYSLTGRWLAEMVAKPEVVEVIEIAGPYSHLDLHLEEVSVLAESQLVGRQIGDPTLRTIASAAIIGCREHETIIPNPPPERVIVADDTVLVLGTREQIHRFRSVARERTVSATSGEES
jgi:voltage-gated potassium channel